MCFDMFKPILVKKQQQQLRTIDSAPNCQLTLTVGNNFPKV